MQNDICILAVEDIGLERRPTVDRACLPEPGWLPEAGTRCWAAGWGVTEQGTFPTDLQEVDLDILSNEQCASGANFGYVEEQSMFCAGLFLVNLSRSRFTALVKKGAASASRSAMGIFARPAKG